MKKMVLIFICMVVWNSCFTQNNIQYLTGEKDDIYNISNMDKLKIDSSKQIYMLSRRKTSWK